MKFGFGFVCGVAFSATVLVSAAAGAVGGVALMDQLYKPLKRNNKENFQ